jgi:hypothetical protein
MLEDKVDQTCLCHLVIELKFDFQEEFQLLDMEHLEPRNLASMK